MKLRRGALKGGFLKKGILLLLIIANITLLVGILKKEGSANKYSEIQSFTGRESFSELKEAFISLAEEKGGEYAFEVLKFIKVRPDIDMHLMGHYIGEILYKQKGADGMEYCTHDFRNACSHTIVVGLFSEKGLGAMSEITKACKKAPGGRGAYNMCFHGLGHGVLAYVGYDVPRAIEICSGIKKSRVDGREGPECVGGAIMEIISGGDHDKTLWTAKKQEYMGGDDPLYPCDSNIVPLAAKERCYSYLTPHLFEVAGGNLSASIPREDDFAKAFSYCAQASSEEDKEACYGGFGKEFVVLVRLRDIRNVDQITEEEINTVYRWCDLAGDDERRWNCLEQALNSIYWGGENNRSGAIRFCNNLFLSEEIDRCFASLIGTVSFYIGDSQYKDSFCEEIPDKYRDSCSKII